MSAGFAAEDTTLVPMALQSFPCFNLIYPAAFYRCLNRISYVFHAPRRVDKDTIPLPNYHESHRVRVGKEMSLKQINIYRARRGHQPKEYSASASYLQIEIA